MLLTEMGQGTCWCKTYASRRSPRQRRKTDPEVASRSFSSRSLSVWYAFGMSHGNNTSVSIGRTVESAEATHKFSNCFDSPGAPLGLQFSHSRTRAPQLEAIELPRL